MLINLLLQKETGDILVNFHRVEWTKQELLLLQFAISEMGRQFNRRFSLQELASLMAKEGDTMKQSVERFQITRNSISDKILEVSGDIKGEIPADFKVLTMNMGVYDFHHLVQVAVE